MLPSGLHVNKPVIFGLFAAGVTLILLYRHFSWLSAPEESKVIGNLKPSSLEESKVIENLKPNAKSSLPEVEESKVIENLKPNAKSSSPEVEESKVIENLKPIPRSATPADSKMATEDVLVAPRLEDLPPLDDEAEKVIKQDSKEFEVTVGDMKLKIHVEQFIKDGVSPKLDILLLHGAKFSSQNWVELKTTHHIANWGYRAVAIDLPGKGKSSAPEEFEEAQYADFLGAFISSLQMKKVVIVAPSLSGKYALPYLLNDPKTSTDRAVGFVPIAPVDTQLYNTKYPESQVPTLIVYGTKDISGAVTLNNLQLFPKHEIAPLEGAEHACYIDKPDNFHKLLFHFFKEVAN